MANNWIGSVCCSGVVCPSVVPKPPAAISVGPSVRNTSSTCTVATDGDNADVTIIETPVPVVPKKVYDLMDDLLEADVLKLYRQVLSDEEAQVKAGLTVFPFSNRQGTLGDSVLEIQKKNFAADAAKKMCSERT